MSGHVSLSFPLHVRGSRPVGPSRCERMGGLDSVACDINETAQCHLKPLKPPIVQHNRPAVIPHTLEQMAVRTEQSLSLSLGGVQLLVLPVETAEHTRNH